MRFEFLYLYIPSGPATIMHQNFASSIFATLIVKLAKISIPTVLKWRGQARLNCWARWWTWWSWEPKRPPRFERIINILHCKFFTMSTEFYKNISDSSPDYTDHKKDSYFWSLNKSYLKINAIFVISAIRALFKIFFNQILQT